MVGLSFGRIVEPPAEIFAARANETFQGTAPRIAPAAQLIGLMPDLILAGSTINLAVDRAGC